MREGSTKCWGTKTIGDLWKREGLSGVHGVNRMDTSVTFRRENREFEEGRFGVDKLSKKISWFWMGKI